LGFRCSHDYIYGPDDTPVETIDLATANPTYLTYTPTDDTWLATTNNGDLVGYWGYDAYGTLAFGTPVSAFGYSGQYTDQTTGLVNDRARWYQPQTGTFTTRDPAFASTDAAYVYGGDDPVGISDPTGKDAASPCALVQIPGVNSTDSSDDGDLVSSSSEQPSDEGKTNCLGIFPWDSYQFCFHIQGDASDVQYMAAAFEGRDFYFYGRMIIVQFVTNSSYIILQDSPRMLSTPVERLESLLTYWVFAAVAPGKYGALLQEHNTSQRSGWLTIAVKSITLS
jgi:RHS repeat-associated protein